MPLHLVSQGGGGLYWTRHTFIVTLCGIQQFTLCWGESVSVQIFPRPPPPQWNFSHEELSLWVSEFGSAQPPPPASQKYRNSHWIGFESGFLLHPRIEAQTLFRFFVPPPPIETSYPEFCLQSSFDYEKVRWTQVWLSHLGIIRNTGAL